MRRIVRRRPTPALVVAMVALLVALGGTSAAAVALLPRNSVGSSQVIDGSLRSKDFVPGELAATTEVFSRSVAGPVVLQVGDNKVSVATLSVPEPGMYLIFAKAQFAVSDTGINCDLIAAGRTDTSGASLPPSAGAGAAVNTTLTHVVVQGFESGGSVELRCASLAKNRRVVARDITLAALRVASTTTS